MGNFSGKSPKWISNELAGHSPAYPSQLDNNLRLEKDLETEFKIFKSWVMAEGGRFNPTGTEFSEADKAAFDRIGRPVLVSIWSDNGSNNLPDYITPDSLEEALEMGYMGDRIAGVDLVSCWVKSGPEGKDNYYSVIDYYVEGGSGATDLNYHSKNWGGHRKGLIKGSYTGEVSEETFIIPKVKTYSFTGNPSGIKEDEYGWYVISDTEANFEEVYDSAEINIRTGQITLWTSDSSKAYLVVIY